MHIISQGLLSSALLTFLLIAGARFVAQRKSQYIILASMLLITAVLMASQYTETGKGLASRYPATMEFSLLAIWAVGLLWVSIRAQVNLRVFQITFWTTWLLLAGAMLIESTGISLAPWVMLVLVIALLFLCIYTLERLTRSGKLDYELYLAALAAGGLMLFDLLHVALKFTGFRLDFWFGVARPPVYLMVSTLLLLRNTLFEEIGSTKTKLRISYEAAYWGSAIVSTALLVMLVILTASLINDQNGSVLNAVLTGLLLLLAGTAVGSLLSDNLRNRLRVLISKHFFSYKYDYRREWLQVSSMLNNREASSNVEELALASVIKLMHADAGILWVRSGSDFILAAGEGQERVQSLPGDSTMVTRMGNEGWIYVLGAPSTKPVAQYNGELADEVLDIPALWLLVPIMTDDTLVAVVGLQKARQNETIDWEDLDILRAIGGQLAGYLQLQIYERQREEQAQLAIYSHMSSFLMHDMNNVVNQLALVVKNSERHKENPEFIDDAFSTVDNAVNRMKGTLAKLNSGRAESRESCDLNDVIHSAIQLNHKATPVPILTSDEAVRTVECDRGKMQMSLSHLIKNAQDACREGGDVSVEISTQGKHAIIQIQDSGMGMDHAFVKEKLFKPFESTKEGAGMGVGAYLTKTYIEQLGGSISVNSAPGQGTCFTLRLPLAGTI